MPTDQSVLDEIIYARVLITLQRMQLDEQDRELREHLSQIVDVSPNGAQRCQESLKRAWIRASDNLGVAPEGVEEVSLAV